MARHLPDRCLRQYGYVQDIPQLGLAIPFGDIDSSFCGNIMSFACGIRDCAVEVQFPTECVDGYLEWYVTLSHLRHISFRQHGDDVEPSHVGFSRVGYSHVDVGVPSDSMSPPPPLPYGADNAQRL